MTRKLLGSSGATGAAQHNLGPKAKNLCGAFNM